MRESIFESVEIDGEAFTGEFVLLKEKVDQPCEVCEASPAWRILLGIHTLEGKSGKLPTAGKAANKVWDVIGGRYRVGRIVCDGHLND